MKDSTLDHTHDLAHTLLQQHGIDDNGAVALASALSTCFKRDVIDGEALCSEGDPASEMWVLTRGTVRVLKKDYLGTSRELAMIHAPALLGHMALVVRKLRSATCIAAGDVEVVVLDHGRFEALERDPGPSGDIIRRLLISSMTRQLHRGNNEIRRIIHNDAAENAFEEDATDRIEPEMLQAEATFDGWVGAGSTGKPKR
jgi:CRP-like cAMP-binding protein